MRDYSPIARRVLDAGYAFIIEASGKPRIVILEPVDLGEEGMDTAGIIKAAKAMGCKDKDSLANLQFGALSHSEPSKVSVYFPNQGGAREYAALLDELLAEEV